MYYATSYISGNSKQEREAIDNVLKHSNAIYTDEPIKGAEEFHIHSFVSDDSIDIEIADAFLNPVRSMKRVFNA